MNTYNLKIALLVSVLVVPLAAKANMIWPSVYIVCQYYTWYVIAIGLIVEFFAIKFFAKASWVKSVVIVIVINAISAILGIYLIPISGIIGELILFPFSSGTFHLSHWVLAYLLAVFSNACVEGLALKLCFKYPFKKNYWWLMGANAVSVLICAFVPLPEIM